MPTNMYEVERVIGKKVVNSRVFYRVQWKDYPLEQSTWEAVSHLRYIQDLVDEYERANPQPSNDSDRNKTTDDRSSTQDHDETILRHHQKGGSKVKTVWEKEVRKKGIRKENESKQKKKRKEVTDLSSSSRRSANLTLADESQQLGKLKSVRRGTSTRFIIEEEEDWDSALTQEEKIVTKKSSASKRKRNSSSKAKGMPRKIRLLEPNESGSQIKEYLVQYGNGELRVLTTVEMTLAHPFEFIDYLQKKVSRK